MFGSGPDEPDDPEESIPEQYREPSVEDLEPSPELEEKFDDVEVPKQLARDFWGLVATINVGLFAAALGLMLLGFEGDWRRGGAAFGLGSLLLVYAYYKYQRVRPDRQD